MGRFTSVMRGSDESPPDEIDVTAMTNLIVVLRDERGAPIPNAEVMAYAMRMREGGGHGYWYRKVYGQPKTVLSNEQGFGTNAWQRRRTVQLISLTADDFGSCFR